MGSISNKIKHMRNDQFVEWLPLHVDEVSADEETLKAAISRWEKLMPGEPFPRQAEKEAESEAPAPPEMEGYDEAVAEKIAAELTGRPAEAEEDKRLPGDPDRARQHVPEVLLSESERILASLIAASDEYPEIDLGDILDRKSALALPSGLARPEYRYKWVDLQDVKGQLTVYNGRWAPVNATNHSHFKRNIWSDTGGIIYRGQLILCFMPRQVGDALINKTIKEFSMKADEMVESLNRRYHDPAGREVVVVERTSDPGDVGGEDLVTEEEYDFGPPEV